MCGRGLCIDIMIIKNHNTKMDHLVNEIEGLLLGSG
jgi:hypothetical protein